MSDVWYTPEPTSATREYWDATAEERLVVPYCTDCGDYFFYPRGRCPVCTSPAIEHREATGRATLVTYTTIHRPPVAALREQAPYVNAIVELEEGVRMMANIEAESEADLEVGMPLEVTWAETDGEIKLPNFRPR